jgi:competence protein ComEA
MKNWKAIAFAVLMAASGSIWAAAVDINTADAKALESLNGIGPAKAQAIVDYRTKNGPFRMVDDLAKVPGIKAATVDKNRELATVGGTAAAKPEKAAKIK